MVETKIHITGKHTHTVASGMPVTAIQIARVMKAAMMGVGYIDVEATIDFTDPDGTLHTIKFQPNTEYIVPAEPSGSNVALAT